MAGFVGTSNLLEGEVARAVVGPGGPLHRPPREDPPARPRRTVRPGECTATGLVVDVVYLGSETRYVVALDAGGELVVMQQNLTTSSTDALAARGRTVRLAWGEEHSLLLPEWRKVTRPHENASLHRRGRGGSPGDLAGCGDDKKKDDTASRRGRRKTLDHRRRLAARSSGPGEGAVNIIAWAGYVENGSNDPKVDWVTGFEKDDRLQGQRQGRRDTSDEMVTLMKTGQYDGVSASGDATLRLIRPGTWRP